MLSVLYVDDEPGLLEVGKIFLERMGDLAVDVALSAKDAISALNTHTYDCIVSDYQMPVMDGIEFLIHVRETAHAIPFILFTGKGREEVVIHALNNGADFYLQKGGDPKAQFTELAHKIRMAVERRRSADRLRDSEQRLSDILNFLPDATFAVDCTGTVISWNKAMEKLTGVAREQVIGSGNYEYSLHVFGERKPLLLDMIIRDLPDLKNQYTSFTRTGDQLIAERFIQQLNQGEGIYAWVIASPLYDAEGMITGAVESIRDITSRRKAEDELRAAYEQLAAAEEELRQQYTDLSRSEAIIRDNERRLADIISFLPDATFAIDLNGVVIAWNKAMEEMTGVPSAEILGTGDYSYALPMVGERRPILVDAVLRADATIEAKYPSLERRDGKLIAEIYAPVFYGGKGAYVWFVASPLYDSEGRITGAIESIRDVTDRRTAQESLEKAYTSLAVTEEELRRQYEAIRWSEKRIREDEQFIRSVFSSIQDGIAILDTDLTIIEVNDAMGCLGDDQGQVIGKKCYEVYHRRSTPCDPCPALQTLRSGFPDHKPVNRISSDGRPSTLDVYSYPLYDPQEGKITGVIEYIRGLCSLCNTDDTDQKT